MLTIALAQRDAKLGKMLTSVADHFLKDYGGKPRNLQVVGLDQVISNIRGGDLINALHRLESKWIYRMDAVALKGLNEELLFTAFLG